MASRATSQNKGMAIVSPSKNGKSAHKNPAISHPAWEEIFFNDTRPKRVVLQSVRSVMVNAFAPLVLVDVSDSMKTTARSLI
jgi:hypothetical protein